MAKFTILESHHFPWACTRSGQIHTRKRKVHTMLPKQNYVVPFYYSFSRNNAYLHIPPSYFFLNYFVLYV